MGCVILIHFYCWYTIYPVVLCCSCCENYVCELQNNLRTFSLLSLCQNEYKSKSHRLGGKSQVSSSAVLNQHTDSEMCVVNQTDCVCGAVMTSFPGAHSRVDVGNSSHPTTFEMGKWRWIMYFPKFPIISSHWITNDRWMETQHSGGRANLPLFWCDALTHVKVNRRY